MTLLLVDKGYYDYDYEKPKFKASDGGKSKPKTDRETERMVARYGVGTAKRKKPKADVTRSADVTQEDVKNMDMERLQAYAMAQGVNK